MEHKSTGNERVDGGIVHHCSCGWTSRPCFSNAIASIEGENHREQAKQEEAHDAFVAEIINDG